MAEQLAQHVGQGANVLGQRVGVRGVTALRCSRLRFLLLASCVEEGEAGRRRSGKRAQEQCGHTGRRTLMLCKAARRLRI